MNNASSAERLPRKEALGASAEDFAAARRAHCDTLCSILPMRPGEEAPLVILARAVGMEHLTLLDGKESGLSPENLTFFLSGLGAHEQLKGQVPIAQILWKELPLPPVLKFKAPRKKPSHTRLNREALFYAIAGALKVSLEGGPREICRGIAKPLGLFAKNLFDMLQRPENGYAPDMVAKISAKLADNPRTTFLAHFSYMFAAGYRAGSERHTRDSLRMAHSDASIADEAKCVWVVVFNDGVATQLGFGRLDNDPRPASDSELREMNITFVPGVRMPALRDSRLFDVGKRVVNGLIALGAGSEWFLSPRTEWTRTRLANRIVLSIIAPT